MSALTRRSLALGLVIGSLVVVAAAAPHRGAPSVSSLVVGQYNACAVVGGTVKCWGANDRQFENSGREALATPITVSDLPRRPGAIALGNQSLCVLTAAGGVQCRGKNDFGQLGNGVASSSAKFVNALGLKSGVRMVAIGTFTTCALRTDRTLKCWGANTNGQIGNGTSNFQPNPHPATVSGLGGRANGVAPGESHTCALMSRGGIKCWGAGDDGELGNGKRKESDRPVSVIGLSKDVKAVAGGGDFTCALTARGGVECWGYNKFGELGDGTRRSRAKPMPVAGLRLGVKAIATGTSHSCALTNAGAVKCWGSNVHGALGIGSTRKNIPSPVAVKGLGSGVKAIGAGNFYSCALTSSGVKCWGSSEYGQLGNGARTDSRVPVAVHLGG